MSRLDYCIAVLASLPQLTHEPLQHIQNAAAHLIYQLNVCDHITPSLMVLHWLPVCCHIDFKLCVSMFAVHSGRCPAYLADIIRMSCSTRTHAGLRLAFGYKYMPYMPVLLHEINYHQTFVLQPAMLSLRNYLELTLHSIFYLIVSSLPVGCNSYLLHSH